MALLKGREMVFKAFESGIFLKPEQSEQSSSNDKYTSLKLYDNLNTSNNASNNSFSNDSDVPLFTPKKGTGLEILTPKKILQRLPIAVAQIKVGNNSENLLNEIRQIVYSLYQSNETTKKVYNNITKSLQI